MRDSILYSSFMAMISVFLAGCIPANIEPEPPRAIVNFDYTPPSEAIPGSADATFAIVGTRFDTPISLFRTFASNMTKDFGEIVTARGFGVRGPFMTYDDMTYSDKEGSDLMLTAEVEFSSDTSQIQYSSFGIPSGSVTVKCHISLMVSESITNERLWTRSIAITPFTVSLISRKAYTTRASLANLLVNENRFYSDVSQALEVQYAEIMNKIHGYLEAKEMAILTQSARDLRKKKVIR